MLGFPTPLSLKSGRQFDPAPDHQISNALSWANARIDICACRYE
jgi:hypothetical protein